MNSLVLKSRDKELRAEEVAPGVTHIQLKSFWTRRLGFGVSCFLVDDVLIDCGFSNAGPILSRFLGDRKIRAICCTHNHEDHTGNCGGLARKFGCPVYLHNPEKHLGEGVGNMPPYRVLTWGRPDDCQFGEMPQRISTRRRELLVIEAPGHSQTHVVFFDESSGLLFLGDLFITASASAVMSHENPYQSIASLRTAAGLGAQKMLNGHGLMSGQVHKLLTEKADRIETTANQILKLHALGLKTSQIVHGVYRDGRLKDIFMATITQGEFCRANFVRACIRWAPAQN